MIAWLEANIGTIVIALLLMLIVVGIVASMIRGKKQGKKSCCDTGCGHCNACNPTEEKR